MSEVVQGATNTNMSDRGETHSTHPASPREAWHLMGQLRTVSRGNWNHLSSKQAALTWSSLTTVPQTQVLRDTYGD